MYPFLARFPLKDANQLALDRDLFEAVGNGYKYPGGEISRPDLKAGFPSIILETYYNLLIEIKFLLACGKIGKIFGHNRSSRAYSDW